MTTLCPVCSNPVESDAAACPQCGFKLFGATQRFYTYIYSTTPRLPWRPPRRPAPRSTWCADRLPA